jgi:hypothetical protein
MGMIPRADWAAIKGRLTRTPALRVQSSDRRSIHAALKLLADHYPDARPFAHVLPVSTMQWSSVVIGRNGSHVAFVDVEQANALSLLLSRGFWLEMPIFSYVEFMIRAAEACYDDGDLPLAAALSERANARLREYCRHHDSGIFVPRPSVFDPILLDIMESRVVLGFIVGHELGHLLQQVGNPGVSPLFDWVAARYDQTDTDAGEEFSRMRFLGQEIVQKFDRDGKADGYVIQGTKMAPLFQAMRTQQIKEVQSDALGVIVASEAAMAAGIPVETMFGLFLTTLENTEMLMVLRRMLPRLPRGEKRAAIPLENTSLVARQFMFVRLARGLKDGSAPAPEPVLRYWSALPESGLTYFETLIDNGRLEQLGLRSAIMVRGGIELALQGHLAQQASAEDLIQRLGWAAGSLIVAQAHLSYPEEQYRVECSFDWNPESDSDGLLYGYGSAIRDICALASSERRSRSAVRRADVRRDGTDAAFIEFLRSARAQVFRRTLNPGWASGFEHLLRDPVVDSLAH